jgi:hypothetical protein
MIAAAPAGLGLGYQTMASGTQSLPSKAHLTLPPYDERHRHVTLLIFAIAYRVLETEPCCMSWFLSVLCHPSPAASEELSLYPHLVCAFLLRERPASQPPARTITRRYEARYVARCSGRPQTRWLSSRLETPHSQLRLGPVRREVCFMTRLLIELWRTCKQAYCSLP